MLLLTATITPPADAAHLVRTDCVERLNDYARALTFYLALLKQTFDAIVFAENSNSDVGTLEAIVRAAGFEDRVEFMSFDGLTYPSTYGRGYGDFMAVDHAMQHSNLLRGDVCVWKCTGRYTVANLAALVADRPSVDVYCHFRNFPARICDLYLMSFTRRGHAVAIEGAYRHLRNDAVAGAFTGEEGAFRKLAEAWPSHLSVARRFEHTPLLLGYRGWNNTAYSNSSSLKHRVRKAAQLFAPWLWI